MSSAVEPCCACSACQGARPKVGKSQPIHLAIHLSKPLSSDDSRRASTRGRASASGTATAVTSHTISTLYNPSNLTCTPCIQLSSPTEHQTLRLDLNPPEGYSSECPAPAQSARICEPTPIRHPFGHRFEFRVPNCGLGATSDGFRPSPCFWTCSRSNSLTGLFCCFELAEGTRFASCPLCGISTFAKSTIRHRYVNFGDGKQAKESVREPDSEFYIFLHPISPND